MVMEWGKGRQLGNKGREEGEKGTNEGVGNKS